MEKAILTCALTGVLTDPKQHPVPVTPAQMAAEGFERIADHAGRGEGAHARRGRLGGRNAENELILLERNDENFELHAGDLL